MAAPTPAVVADVKTGEMAKVQEVGAKRGGGLVTLSPLPLSGGRRRRSRKISKKMLKKMKKMTPKQLKKLLKGGDEVMPEEPASAPVGARRRRTRRHVGMFY